MLALAAAIPFLAALLSFLLKGHRNLIALLIGAATLHLGLVVSFWVKTPMPFEPLSLELDGAGQLVLTVASIVFFAVSLYTPGYLLGKGMEVTKTYVACALVMLGAMTISASTLHLGILWVAVEASTLAGAPLLAHRTTPSKLEATWKYLLLCSVGVALALLGTIFLGIGATQTPTPISGLTVSELTRVAPEISGVWLRMAFVLLLVGYGTKMGLAPVNAWVPDAYSEAPSTASALFSGAISNTAFLGIWRSTAVMNEAGLGDFAGNLLIGFGMTSLLLAAVFILKQKDLKRMLAYSSVENYGLLALGLGLGGVGAYGSMLHMVAHSLAKAMLFMVAGNILVACGTRSVKDLGGLLARAPKTGVIFAAGFFAVAGSPPFMLFWSELSILRATMQRPFVAVLSVAILGVIFIGMTNICIKVLQGVPAVGTAVPERAAEPASTFIPPLLLAVALLILGLYIPPALDKVIIGAASALG